MMESERVDLGDGLSLVRGRPRRRAARGGLARATTTGRGRRCVCVLEREVQADDQIPGAEARGALPRARDRAAAVGAGRVAPLRARLAAHRRGPLGGGSRSAARARPAASPGRSPRTRRTTCASSSRRSSDTPGRRPVGWALARFEMGCERAHEAEALSDYLLGLRALLDATSDGGRGQPGAARGRALRRGGPARGRCSAGSRRALSLERFLMGGRGSLQERIGSESPARPRARAGAHLRALLRDVLCGYLEPGPEERGRRHPARDRRPSRSRSTGARAARSCGVERDATCVEPEPEAAPSRSRRRTEFEASGRARPVVVAARGQPRARSSTA